MAPWPSPGGLSFVVYVDGERVIARVSAEVLQLHFGAANPGDATLARAFYAHAGHLQERAVRQYRLRPAQPLDLVMDDTGPG
ncbi:MAG: DUF1488 family protein [Polaromonas sp.]|nr:DUF1488 family protein [Polaromonas sp.]